MQQNIDIATSDLITHHIPLFIYKVPIKPAPETVWAPYYGGSNYSQSKKRKLDIFNMS